MPALHSTLHAALVAWGLSLGGMAALLAVALSLGAMGMEMEWLW